MRLANIRSDGVSPRMVCRRVSMFPSMERQMWFSTLRAVVVVPALFAAYFGLATSAHALPAPLPALLPDQQDGVF